MTELEFLLLQELRNLVLTALIIGTTEAEAAIQEAEKEAKNG